MVQGYGKFIKESRIPFFSHSVKSNINRLLKGSSRATCMDRIQVSPVTPVWPIAITLILGGGGSKLVSFWFELGQSSEVHESMRHWLLKLLL